MFKIQPNRWAFMSGKNYYLIDNHGAGNCGYFAYAISLMYSLRHANDEAMTGRIFDDILKLKAKDNLYLKKILQDSRHETRIFNREELDNIQTILGPVLRNFAADQAITEFQEKTEASHIFAVANYPMMMTFKEAIADSDITSYRPASRVADFHNAELYRLPDFTDAIRKYFHEHKEDFLEAYNLSISVLEEEERTSVRKIQIFEGLVKYQTIAFFNGTEILKQYRDHLATNRKWASEETLLCMHRAIQNEHRVEDPIHRARDGEPRITWESENPITYGFARDGVRLSDETPEIFLNNQHNAHWTSIIDEDLLADIPEHSRPRDAVFEVRSFSKKAPTSNVIDPEKDTISEETRKQQQQLLEYYAKLKKKTKGPKDNSVSSITKDDSINTKPSPGTNSQESTTGETEKTTTSPIVTDEDIEKEREKLSFLTLKYGERQVSISKEVDSLIKEQKKIAKSLETIDERLKQITMKISQKTIEVEKLVKAMGSEKDLDAKLNEQEDLLSEQLGLELEKEEKQLELIQNKESLMRLLAIDEAEHSMSPSPSATNKSPVEDVHSDNDLSSSSTISEETQSNISGSWMLSVLFSAAKNAALFAVAVLAGVAVGLIVASTVIGVPAAIGLGVATTAVTGATLFSLFNRSGNQEETNTPNHPKNSPVI